MEESKLKALVVDDEGVIRDFLSRLLVLNSVEVKSAVNGFRAIEMAQSEEFDLIFLDVRMPDMDGFKALKELKGISPKTRYVMMTGYVVDNLLEEARKEGDFGFVKKPFVIEEIIFQIEEARRLKKGLKSSGGGDGRPQD